MEIGND